MKTLILITGCFLLTHLSVAQVKINRYTTSQVSSNGLWGKKTLDKEIIIPEMDIDAIYKKWESQKVSKFAEPVDVDISIYDQGSWETVDSFNVIRIKITAKKASSIAVYFDKLFLSPNAELYIYSSDGTIITGPITEEENINSNKMWGSNVFSGTSVILELKTPISETDSNKLHIQKILYGINPKIKLPYSNKDSTTGPGFGLSSSCNINAICIAGWEQERRAIAQVVHGNGGWCSASLIMNTCNTNIPYVLTANHCVVDGNGNPINTSNSTFEFLWFSPTCTPTTNTSSTLLFNGASIQARWEQSDFALLKLNQTIPQNSTLTFLGWSRSTNPPNNSMGIHHPMGDIMKISIENNQAAIGNVRNFPNTAWRVVWDQGTVEGGSSGSPLFDMNDHRVVGQLFSNTQPTNPPCNQPTGGTNYGRFNVSWEGGGTPATRLRDWLDPNNTGAMTTNTTNVSALPNSITPVGNVIGHYTVNGGTTQYSITNDTYQNLYVPRNSWVSIVFTISTQTFPINRWTFENITANGLNFTAGFQSSPFGYGSVYKNIYLDVGNNCGTFRRTYSFNVVSIGGFGRVAVSPNPTKDILNVSISKETTDSETTLSKELNKIISSGKTNFTISDINTSQVLKRWTFNESKLMNYNLDIRGLKAGVYVLTTERNGKTITTKVVVQ
ncbi:MAG: trypsin-like peptidase domain-containing protein [Sphingobacteriales bacterium]|nr:trypsin-like peptidase domain-containing protein [Sphingobacteriales bacterium]MBI3719827.1 trypsin-like peptidase domain-containing protein [Sphingobacteriales bacterium]